MTSVSCRFRRKSCLRAALIRGVIATYVAIVPTLADAHDFRASHGLSAIGRIAPKPSPAVASSPWGLCNKDAAPNSLSRTRELGVKTVRTHLFWPGIERSKGVYSWGTADGAFDYYRENAIELFVGFSCASAVYGVEAPTRSAEALRGWKAFIAAAVQRYRERVHYWEICNEPNLSNFWKPTPNPAEYGLALKEASATIKAVDPQAKVVGGVTAGIPMRFIEDVLKSATGSVFEVFTYHAYSNWPEVWSGRPFAEAVAGLRSLLERHGFRGQLWQGEAGYPSDANSIHWRGDGPWSEQIQATYIPKRLFTDWFAGAERATYFPLLEFKGHQKSHDPTSPLGTNTKGLLALPDRRPKPAYFVLQRLVAATAGMKRTRAVAASFNVTQATHPGSLKAPLSSPTHGSYEYPTGRKALVYWAPLALANAVVPGKVTVVLPNAAALGWVTPVLVDVVSDAVYALRSAQKGADLELTGLPLAEYPLILADRADVSLQAGGGGSDAGAPRDAEADLASDAGSSLKDAGATNDGGTGLADRGRNDARPHADGSPPRDARGTTPSEAGGPAPGDAGSETPPDGCCRLGSGPPPPLAWVVLGLILWRRRRWRSCRE